MSFPFFKKSLVMKNYLTLFFFAMLCTVGFQQDAFACNTPFANANITGPSGRCGAPAGVPTTYTGTHNFSSSGCTIYEWTVSGGTVIAPGISGTSITNGTLCVAENNACATQTSNACQVQAVHNSVASGNGSTVTVIWSPNVEGTLALRVRELGGVNLRAEDEITNDITLPSLISISTSNQTSGSGTYTANLDNTLCPGMAISWTVNGNNAGTGNPRNLNVGYCSDAQVCASITLNGISAGQKCINVNGQNFSSSISGPSTSETHFPETFIFNSTQPIASISWYASPPEIAEFMGPTNNPEVGVRFNDVGVVDICAVGITSCGSGFERCKKVTVANFKPNFQDPSQSKVSIASTEMIVFPTLIDQQQELNIQLPTLEETAMLRIVNINGSVVLEQKATDQRINIATNQLGSGMYVLTAQSGNWISTKKFVVK